MQNKNLKSYQKILPTLGYSLGILVTLPLAIIIVAGAAALIPPFVFAASCVAVVRNTAIYLEERSERNNLRKELISKNDLLEKIAKAKLAPEADKIVQEYLQGRDALYNELYSARQALITNGSLSVAQKRAEVLILNKIIEDLYSANQQEAKQQVLQLQQIAERLKEANLTALGQQLQDYGQLCDQYQQLTIAPSLKKAITLYQFSHEKIYSQDLPGNIKQQYIQMMEGEKIKGDDLKLLYSHLGNRYINQTPLQQVLMQDDNFEDKLKRTELTPQEIEAITAYNRQPRAAYDKIIELREKLPAILEGDPNKEKKLALFEEFRRALIAYPDGYHQDWQRCKAQFGNAIFFKEIDAELSNLEMVTQAFDGLQLSDNLKDDAKDHRQNTFNQYANSHQAEFPAPHFNFDLQANDLLQRSGFTPKLKKVFSVVDKGFNKVSTKVKESVLRKIAQEPNEDEDIEKEHQAQMSVAKKAMRTDFNQRYEGIFNIVEKKERLNFLIKAVPRRIVNIGLSVVLALTSLATTIILPAVASPAAPAAAIATTVLGVLSALLTTASVTNSAHLIYKQIKGKLKLRSTHTTVAEGVIPDISYDKKIHSKGKEKIAKKQSEEAKEVVVEKVKAQTPIQEVVPTQEVQPIKENIQKGPPGKGGLSRPAVLLANIMREAKPAPLKPTQKKSAEVDPTKGKKP